MEYYGGDKVTGPVSTHVAVSSSPHNFCLNFHLINCILSCESPGGYKNAYCSPTHIQRHLCWDTHIKLKRFSPTFLWNDSGLWKDNYFPATSVSEGQRLAEYGVVKSKCEWTCVGRGSSYKSSCSSWWLLSLATTTTTTLFCYVMKHMLTSLLISLERRSTGDFFQDASCN